MLGRAEPERVGGDQILGEPNAQQSLDQRGDTVLARGRSAFESHLAGLVGLALRGVDQHELVDQRRPGRGEMPRHQPAKRDADDMRARYAGVRKDGGELAQSSAMP